MRTDGHEVRRGGARASCEVTSPSGRETHPKLRTTHLEVGHGDGPAESDGGVAKHVGANLAVPEVVVKVVGHGGEGHSRSLGDDGRDGRHGR